ncbi:MAG: glycosyltransferase [Eubacteriales bacterium]
MKILILSRSMGGGHNAAAHAVAEALESRGVHADVVDASVFTEVVVKDASSFLYVRAVQRVPSLFGYVYHIADNISTPKFKSVLYYANHKGAGKMLDYITENGYDGVVSPHLYPIETLTYLKRRHGLSVPCFGIATDYTCIPFWEDTEMDFYFTPGEKLHSEYIEKNMPEEKLIPTGIPVSQRFLHKTEKSEAKKKLGLEADKRYFLIMSGSMGAGNALAVTKEILKNSDITPIIICGSNKKLKDEMEREVGGGAVLTGFTNEVELYMNASEAVFTKAGGLTSTEAAAFGIPIVHTKPIPGCETKNTEYFSSLGMSIHDDNVPLLVKKAVELVNDDKKVEKMLAAQRKYVNPHAAEDIAEKIILECSER